MLEKNLIKERENTRKWRHGEIESQRKHEVQDSDSEVQNQHDHMIMLILLNDLVCDGCYRATPTDNNYNNNKFNNELKEW
jgi:hypothetical protein